MTDDVIATELANQIRDDLRLLTSLFESLALYNMMVNSFVNLISTNPTESYVRPKFTGITSQNDMDFLVQ